MMEWDYAKTVQRNVALIYGIFFRIIYADGTDYHTSVEGSCLYGTRRKAGIAGKNQF